MIVVGVAAVLASNQRLRKQLDAYHATVATDKDIEAKLRRARDEEAEIKQKIAKFAELQARGIIGPEQRLLWVERIRQLRDGLKLFDLQYEIAPQRALDVATAPGSSGSFDFLASTMRLEMQLLHEGDLLGFIDKLRASVPAFVRVRECRMVRTETVTEDGAAARPELKADCLLDWITIDERAPNA